MPSMPRMTAIANIATKKRQALATIAALVSTRCEVPAGMPRGRLPAGPSSTDEPAHQAGPERAISQATTSTSTISSGRRTKSTRVCASEGTTPALRSRS